MPGGGGEEGWRFIHQACLAQAEEKQASASSGHHNQQQGVAVADDGGEVSVAGPKQRSRFHWGRGERAEHRCHIKMAPLQNSRPLAVSAADHNGQ